MSFFNLTMVGPQNTFTANAAPSGEAKPTNNSNLKYYELRTKHVRTDKEPSRVLSEPLTSSQQIGWWAKDEPIGENLPWTHVEKRVFPMSEMTSFVDRMSLADKSFKMY